MANDALTLNFGNSITVHIEGKNAGVTQNKPISDITFSATHPQVSIIVATGQQNFIVTNTNPTAGGSGQIFWSAKNELGTALSGSSNYTLVPSDPATSLEVKIVA